MKRLAVLLLLLCYPAAPAGANDDVRRNWLTELTARAKPSVAQIVYGDATDTPRATAFVVGETGILVTTRHAISLKKKTLVKLGDKLYKPTVLVSDPAADLAVLKIWPPARLKPLPLGKDVIQGEQVAVYGHPYGLTNSVCHGIVSGLDRTLELPSGDYVNDAFQTDAPINPGNSGGPVLNRRGEVVGVIVAMRTGSQSLGFALHVGSVRRALAKLPKVDR